MDIVSAAREYRHMQETATSLLGSSFQVQVKIDRMSGADAITDKMILLSAEIIDYPYWNGDGIAYTRGDILSNGGGLLFEVVADHTSNVVYPPETTFAYYRLIELVHTGAIDDPIPYPEAAGVLVNVISGLYYSYKGAVYLAKTDMPNCIYPPDTVGMWQWELVTTLPEVT